MSPTRMNVVRPSAITRSAGDRKGCGSLLLTHFMPKWWPGKAQGPKTAIDTSRQTGGAFSAQGPELAMKSLFSRCNPGCALLGQRA